METISDSEDRSSLSTLAYDGQLATGTMENTEERLNMEHVAEHAQRSVENGDKDSILEEALRCAVMEAEEHGDSDGDQMEMECYRHEPADFD